MFSFPPLWRSRSTHTNTFQRRNIPWWSILWLCSCGIAVSYIFGTQSKMIMTFAVLLVGLIFYSPIAVSVGWGDSGLLCLRPGRSEETSWRTQIHLIRWLWLFHGIFFSSWWPQTSFVAPMIQRKTGGWYFLPVLVRTECFPWCLHGRESFTIGTSCQNNWPQ